MDMHAPNASAIQNTLKNLLQRKDILAALVIFVGGLFFANRIYQQGHRKMQDIKKALVSEEEKAGVGKEVAGLEDKIARISGPYLKKDSSLIMDKLNNLMAEARLEVISFSPLASEEGAHYTKNLFRISLRANYHRLGAFISLLESQPDLMRIEELSLSGFQEGVPGKRNNLNVDIRVSVTFLKGK
jgi:hypothetical protein